MARIDGLRDACTNLVLRENHSDFLWHYTSAASLALIAESSSLHLCCHNFMNDPAEGLQSAALVTRCWHNAIDRISGHPQLDLEYLRDTSRELLSFGKYNQHVPPAFFASFSVLRDSLSQWARYGMDGAGVALGFLVDPTAFERFSPTDQWSYGPHLYKVFYEESADSYASSVPRAEIAQLSRELEDLIYRFIVNVDNPTEVQNALHFLAHDLKPVIKQAAYHEEQEWRIAAHTVEDSTGIYHIRSGRFGLSPHMVLPLGRGIELKEVMLGPKLATENEWSVAWLCRKYGIKPAITRSGFSYR